MLIVSLQNRPEVLDLVLPVWVERLVVGHQDIVWLVLLQALPMKLASVVARVATLAMVDSPGPSSLADQALQAVGSSIGPAPPLGQLLRCLTGKTPGSATVVRFVRVDIVHHIS